VCGDAKAVFVGFVTDGAVDLGRHLRLGRAEEIVNPDLDDVRMPCSHFLDDSPGFLRSFGTSDLVFANWYGRGRSLHSESAVGREDFCAAKFSGSLPFPPAVEQILVYAQGQDGGNPIALVQPECGLDVLLGVVVRRYLALLDYAEETMVRDERGDDRLPGAVNDLRALVFGIRPSVPFSHSEDSSVLNDECCILDRWLPAAVDQRYFPIWGPWSE
jgi:hypothetical protein